MTRRQERRDQRAERLRNAAERVVERFGPTVGATGPVGDLDFEPDGPTCTGAQKGYVRLAVKAAVEQGVLARDPELTEELTIGQAEAILRALGVSPDDLYKLGRHWGAAREQKAWRDGRAMP